MQNKKRRLTLEQEDYIKFDGGDKTVSISVLITFRAIFLSLFIARNCFILDNTALSSGLSDASPSSLIHG